MNCGCNTGSCSPPPAEPAACSGGEVFALRVLGDEMEPEFCEGDIIIVEPDGALKDGSFVLASHAGEWTFRRLARRDGRWFLHVLNPARGDLAEIALPDLSAVHGVIIQKAVPGKRRLTRSYL